MFTAAVLLFILSTLVRPDFNIPPGNHHTHHLVVQHVAADSTRLWQGFVVAEVPVEYFADNTKLTWKNSINGLETFLADAVLVKCLSFTYTHDVDCVLRADIPCIHALETSVDGHRTYYRVVRSCRYVDSSRRVEHNFTRDIPSRWCTCHLVDIQASHEPQRHIRHRDRAMGRLILLSHTGDESRRNE